MEPEVHDLERRRQELLQQMAQIGDMRRGSVNKQYFEVQQLGRKEPLRRGPYYVFSCKVQGKTCSRRVRGAEVEKLQREVDNFHHYQQLSRELMEVNERLCDLRPVEAPGPGKKNSPSRSSETSGGKSAS